MGVLRMLGTLMERSGLAKAAGLTFGGKRDLYQALGYLRDLQPVDYRSRYKRNGIAARVVEAMPKATWRGGVELIEDEDPKTETEFERAFYEMNERLRIWSVLCRADVLAGLGHYSVILIGVPGRLEDPMPNSFGPDQVTYLTPFAEEDAVIELLDQNVDSERFGEPEYYSLSRINPASNSASSKKSISRRVHWSRVIHIADGTLDDCIYGQPRLERVWNLLDDLEKITGAGSEAFWLRAHQGYMVNIDKDLQLSDDPEKETEALEAMRVKIDEFAHGLRRTLLTRGSNVETLGSDVSQFNTQVDALITLISGATGIPKRILVGSERGELASTQDRENWNERITDRRNDFAGPYVIKPLVDILMERGALPEADYQVRWPEINKLTDTEKASVAEKLAGLSAKAGEPVILGSEIRDRILQMPPLTESQLDDIEEKELERQEAFVRVQGENPVAPDDEDEKEQPQPKAALGKGSPRPAPGYSLFARRATAIARKLRT